MTTWLPIPGHPDYEVSNDGRVRSYRKRGYTRGRDAEPRELTQHQMPNGYFKVAIATMGRHPQWVHRLVALAFHGPCLSGHEVRHLDGDRTNNAPSNLTYGTRSENNLDAVAHGTNNMTRKTHCPKGHPYDVENTIVYIRSRRGRQYKSRVCRICQSSVWVNTEKRVGVYVDCDLCGKTVSKANISRHRRQHQREEAAA